MGHTWLPKSQARWVPSRRCTSIAGGANVPKCPVQPVLGHGWVFPLDGDKRLQLLSRVGACGVILAPRNMPLWVQLSRTSRPTCCISPRRHGGGSEMRPTVDTHRVKAAAKRRQERKSFACGLFRHPLSENHQGPQTKHPTGAQSAGKRARKAYECGPEFPSPSLSSLASQLSCYVVWAVAWCGHGMAKAAAKKKSKLTPPRSGHCLKPLEHPNIPSAKPLPLPPVPTSPHHAAPLPIAWCQPEPPQRAPQSG